MSVVLMVVPLVVGGWPVLSAAIIAATAALGYHAAAGSAVASEMSLPVTPDIGERSVEMRMSDAQVVEDTLMRGESLTFTSGGTTATFHVDGRGACTVHVAGAGKTTGELTAIGEELMDRVRQQFAYSKLMEELETRGFSVLDQRMEQDQSIRIRVKR